eukprot:jgi/Psemu1/7824/gm1.7824_g
METHFTAFAYRTLLKLHDIVFYPTDIGDKIEFARSKTEDMKSKAPVAKVRQVKVKRAGKVKESTVYNVKFGQLSKDKVLDMMLGVSSCFHANHHLKTMDDICKYANDCLQEFLMLLPPYNTLMSFRNNCIQKDVVLEEGFTKRSYLQYVKGRDIGFVAKSNNAFFMEYDLKGGGASSNNGGQSAFYVPRTDKYVFTQLSDIVEKLQSKIECNWEKLKEYCVKEVNGTKGTKKGLSATPIQSNRYKVMLDFD